MKTSRTVVNEAWFSNTRRKPQEADFKVDNYKHLPKMVDLKNYLAEITQHFYEQRAKKLGREYQVSSVERMYEVHYKEPRFVFLVKVKAMSTTLKQSPVIGYQTLRPLIKPSKYYELRFLVYIDLSNTLVKNNITNLKRDFMTAQCYYDCNCMSFHYHGIRYRASKSKWAMYPTNIPDPAQRVRFGMNSKVCKHIGAFSYDLMGFVPQIKPFIDSLLKNQ